MLCYLGLGSNLGDREKFIDSAIDAVGRLSVTKILRRSSMLETKPVGYLDQPDFINCVLEIETQLEAQQLLEQLLEIEQGLDRTREIHWGPRTIDIDILLYGYDIIQLPKLEIPHKELYKRKFVLESLVELNPEIIHPVLKKTMKEIYQDLC
jgi:2-amino-4-hydroxy-6-hydroxymethyldihydropteridine diphosphokinase